MAIVAQVTGIGITNDGTQVNVGVSFRDTAQTDPKDDDFFIVASRTFVIDPDATKKNIKDMVLSHGALVAVALAKAQQFAADTPVGTRVPVPNT